MCVSVRACGRPLQMENYNFFLFFVEKMFPHSNLSNKLKMSEFEMRQNYIEELFLQSRLYSFILFSFVLSLESCVEYVLFSFYVHIEMYFSLFVLFRITFGLMRMKTMPRSSCVAMCVR